MNYVAAGYLSTAVLLGLYGWRILHRGRVLSRALGEDAERTRRGSGM